MENEREYKLVEKKRRLRCNTLQLEYLMYYPLLIKLKIL